MNYLKYKTKVSNVTGYLLLFLLLAFSGNPVFIQNKFFLIIFGVLLFMTITMLFLNRKFDFLFAKRLFFYTLYFLVLFFSQLVVLSFVSFEGILNFFFKILVGALIVYLLGDSFREKYLNLIYYLGIISLIGFTINVVGIKTPAIFGDGHISSVILFGTIDSFFNPGEMRNCGMFWEPGAYAGYILLIPLFYMGDLTELWNQHKKKCIVLLITLVTTLSTTGYIIVFLILVYYLLFKSRKKLITYLIFPVVLLGIFAIFTQVDFLGEKIESQFEDTKSSGDDDFKPDRFGALVFDLYYIMKHPLVGNGLHSKTRFADHQFLVDNEESGLMAHGNGFSNFVASMGITSILFYFYLIFTRFPFSKGDSLFVILILFLQLQGEQFLNYPLFLVLPFIMIPNNNFTHA